MLAKIYSYLYIYKLFVEKFSFRPEYCLLPLRGKRNTLKKRVFSNYLGQRRKMPGFAPALKGYGLGTCRINFI